MHDMDPETAALYIDGFPRDFQAKNRQLLCLRLLEKNLYHSLVETYLTFQPRNSFQGLPPLKDQVCLKWVEGMHPHGR